MYLFGSIGILFLWEIFLICNRRFKNEFFFCFLLVLVIGVCRYSIYILSSFSFRGGYGLDVSLIRLILLFLYWRRCCRVVKVYI